MSSKPKISTALTENLGSRLDKDNSLFFGRQLAITSLHKKEKVIAPILKKTLGFEPLPVVSIDTNKFGSFEEVNSRKKSPEDTLVAKCLSGMNLHQLNCGIATEASFFPDPNFPLRTIHEELIVFIDLEYDIRIIEAHVSINTVCFSKRVNSKLELHQLLKQIDFPNQAIFLSWESFINQTHKKHCSSWKEVEMTLEKFVSDTVELEVTSDQRACHNPTRMAVIESVTHQLTERLLRLCPHCSFPGFGKVGTIKGAPCGYCGIPSSFIMQEVYKCCKCNHIEPQIIRGTIDPAHCNFCNP
jgi:hypothetical protein